jgi:hypothetical protein
MTQMCVIVCAGKCAGKEREKERRRKNNKIIIGYVRDESVYNVQEQVQ